MRISDWSSTCALPISFGIDAWPTVIGDAVALRIEAEAQRVRDGDVDGADSDAPVPEEQVPEEQVPEDAVPGGTASDDAPSEEVPPEEVPLEEVPLEEPAPARSEEHTSELQSLMRISYAVFCLKKKKSHT